MTSILLLAGSEKYRSITTGHYRFALGAVLVYDISNADSFKNCRFWLESIHNFADDNVVIALVGKVDVLNGAGNKVDMLNVNQSRREVPKETAEKFARENNLIFIGESSAVSNQNIKEVMDALLERIFIAQSELVKQGKKREATLRISEEEAMLNNHRCCY